MKSNYNVAIALGAVAVGATIVGAVGGHFCMHKQRCLPPTSSPRYK